MLNDDHARDCADQFIGERVASVRLWLYDVDGPNPDPLRRAAFEAQVLIVVSAKFDEKPRKEIGELRQEFLDRIDRTKTNYALGDTTACGGT